MYKNFEDKTFLTMESIEVKFYDYWIEITTFRRSIEICKKSLRSN